MVRVETGKVPWWHSTASMLSGGWKPTVCEEVADDAGVSHHVYNGLSVVQGPNYALAKTLQARFFIRIVIAAISSPASLLSSARGGV